MERILRDKLINGSFGSVPQTHSRRMGAIRGKGNRSTEARFRAMLVRAGLRGWTMQTRAIEGKPDFYFAKERVAVFIDGCFWHGCPRCGHVPKVNRPFWASKIARNKERDRATDKLLALGRVRPIRIWEHELKDSPKACVQRVVDALNGKRGGRFHR